MEWRATGALAQAGALHKTGREQSVGQALDRLGGNYLIIYDVRCQFSHIDHVLLSRDHGVFIIETEAGISHTRMHSDWLADGVQALTGVKATVTPLILSHDATLARNRAIGGVTVTNLRSLVGSVQKLGRPLPPEIWVAREKIAARLN